MSDTVYETSDYAIFNKMTGNRNLSDKFVNLITDSMKKFGWIGAPILVNNKMEVIDGQHRLEAAKKAGVPVKYINMGAKDINVVCELNTTSHVWTTDDYLNRYVALGNENYIKFNKLRTDYNASSPIVWRALNHSLCSRGMKVFKEGKCVISNDEYAAAAYKLSKWAILKETFRALKITAQGSVIDVAIFFIVENYPESVIDNMNVALQNIVKERISTIDTQTLMNCLENVYNRKKRVENKVYFGEDFKHSACGKGNFTRRMKYDGQYQSQKKLL